MRDITTKLLGGVMDPILAASLLVAIVTGIFAVIVALIEVLGAIGRELIIYHLKRKQQRVEVPEQPEE